MHTETELQTDLVFAMSSTVDEQIDSQSWIDRRDDSDALQETIDRAESTLDFIAEAVAAAKDDTLPQDCDLTVIVPVFNERETLPRIMRRIDEVMPRATEVIIVDDASTDGTSEWLEGLPEKQNRKIIRRRANHGKGSAIRLAIKHSHGSVVAIQDADLEYDPAHLLRVVWPIFDGDADVVYGSRYMEGCTDRSVVHRMGNWALTRLSNAVTGLRLTDMETCHKAFDGDMIRSMKLRERRFGFEPEVTAKVSRSDARVMEVPTEYDSRGYSDGKKIGWKDGFAAIGCILKYCRG